MGQPNLAPAALSALRALRDCGVVRVTWKLAVRHEYITLFVRKCADVVYVGSYLDWRLTDVGKKLAEEVL